MAAAVPSGHGFSQPVMSRSTSSSSSGAAVQSTKFSFVDVIGEDKVYEVEASVMDEMVHYPSRLDLDENDLKDIDTWVKQMHRNFIVDALCESKLRNLLEPAAEKGVNFVVVEAHLEARLLKVIMYKVTGVEEYYGASDDDDDDGDDDSEDIK